MTERSRLRLVVLRVLVVSLLVTLFGRLWYLQVLAGERYEVAARDNQVRDIVTPAIRGQILDDMGRPLVGNRPALVVSVDRTALARQPDSGKAVLARLSSVLRLPVAELRARIRVCGPGAAKPCWNGSPYQPIPVTDKANSAMALAILERREQFPGVSAQMTAVRNFPAPEGANAAHLLGYLSPVTDAELAARPGSRTSSLLRTDLVGRSGLEQQYDAALRGQPGARSVTVDHLGAVVREVADRPPVPGATLVTSIDARVQRVVEQALGHAVRRARSMGDRSGRRYRADSAAGVVLDVRTGRVVALASWPTYDPRVWVGGISERDYDALTAPRAGVPLLFRAIQGEWSPASTFKVISTAAAIEDGYPLGGTYACPSSVTVGNRAFHNFESTSLGQITWRTTLVRSCDTVYYRIAYDQWLRDGGNSPVAKPKDPMVTMAKAFGLGHRTGVDLPGEADGRIADRAWKQRFWNAVKDDYCAGMKRRPKGTYLQRLAAEVCLEGYRFRAGDAANFAIGQGDTVVTPLQLAVVYGAVATGGTIWSPRVGKAVLAPDGRVVQRIPPRRAGRVPVDPKVLRFLRRTLAAVPTEGTAAGAFAGFPFDRVHVAGKTGTGQVAHKQDTSWFASFAPADEPQFAVVVVVSQGGQGARVAAPAVREIYEGIYGLAGRPPALPAGAPPAALPRVRSDGSIAPPSAAGPGARP